MIIRLNECSSIIEALHHISFIWLSLPAQEEWRSSGQINCKLSWQKLKDARICHQFRSVECLLHHTQAVPSTWGNKACGTITVAFVFKGVAIISSIYFKSLLHSDRWATLKNYGHWSCLVPISITLHNDYACHSNKRCSNKQQYSRYNAKIVPCNCWKIRWQTIGAFPKW